MRRLSIELALVLLTLGGVAQADMKAPPKPAGYPNRPINFVVSYPAGGGMDITARTLAAQMGRVTGYQFRVQNRGGGGAIIGNTYVAKQARPDGYTVGILANPTMDINILRQGAHFAKSDIEPVAGITFAPVVWLTRSKSKFGQMDFKQILAYAKKNPGQIKMGVIPNGSFDMATRIVERETGAKFTIVPFQGGKPSTVALLGGNVDMSSNYYSEVQQYIDAGTLKPLAVSDNSRAPQLPDTPSMKDLGIKMAPATWGAERFAAVPKGTDPAKKKYLEYLILKTLKDKQTQAAFAKVGIKIDAKTMAEEQKRYDGAYDAVHDYLKTVGELKSGS